MTNKKEAIARLNEINAQLTRLVEEGSTIAYEHGLLFAPDVCANTEEDWDNSDSWDNSGC